MLDRIDRGLPNQGPSYPTSLFLPSVEGKEKILGGIMTSPKNSGPAPSSNWGGAMALLALVVVIVIAVIIFVGPSLFSTSSEESNPINFPTIEYVWGLDILSLILILLLTFLLIKFGDPPAPKEGQKPKKSIVNWMVNLARVPATYAGRPGETCLHVQNPDKQAVTGWYVWSRLIPQTILATLVISTITGSLWQVSLTLGILWIFVTAWRYWLKEADRRNTVYSIYTHQMKTVRIKRTVISWILPGRSKVIVSDTPIKSTLDVLDSTDPQDLPFIGQLIKTSWFQDQYVAIIGGGRKAPPDQRIAAIFVGSRAQLTGDLILSVRHPEYFKGIMKKAAPDESARLTRLLTETQVKFAKEANDLLQRSPGIDLKQAEADYVAPMMEKMGPALVFDIYTGKVVNPPSAQPHGSPPPYASHQFFGTPVDPPEQQTPTTPPNPPDPIV
jgi:hypothetical protein